MLFHCKPVNQQTTSIFALILWEKQRLNHFWNEKRCRNSTFTFGPPKSDSLLLFDTYLVIWKYNCEPLCVKSPTNILLHNSATVIVLSIGRIVHGTICLEHNCTLKLTRTVFSLVAMLKFLLSFSIDQSFKHLSKLVRDTGTLENFKLAVNLKKKILQNYGAAAIFFCTSIKTCHRTKILRGWRCLRTRTFIFFGLSYIIKIFFYTYWVFFFQVGMFLGHVDSVLMNELYNTSYRR